MVDVEVIEIDAKDRRLRVSLKNVLSKPFDEFMKKFKVGDVGREMLQGGGKMVIAANNLKTGIVTGK